MRKFVFLFLLFSLDCNASKLPSFRVPYITRETPKIISESSKEVHTPPSLKSTSKQKDSIFSLFKSSSENSIKKTHTSSFFKSDSGNAKKAHTPSFFRNISEVFKFESCINIVNKQEEFYSKSGCTLKYIMKYKNDIIINFVDTQNTLIFKKFGISTFENSFLNNKTINESLTYFDNAFYAYEDERHSIGKYIFHTPKDEFINEIRYEIEIHENGKIPGS